MSGEGDIQYTVQYAVKRHCRRRRVCVATTIACPFAVMRCDASEAWASLARSIMEMGDAV